MKKNPNKKAEDAQQKPLDPLDYPPSEDIYEKGRKEELFDTEGIGGIEMKVSKTDVEEELNFRKNELSDYLDVPGAELDDRNEKIGEEDEENNYYSLGGENHENLEEP